MNADIALIGIGRKPYTEGLGLQGIGVELDEYGFVKTNSHLQTAVSSVWAIGDVIKGPMLAHKAEEEGIAVAHSIYRSLSTLTDPPETECHMVPEHLLIPNVVYTHPEIAWVGRGETELAKMNEKFRVGKFPFLANSRAKANGMRYANRSGHGGLR